MSNHRRIQNCTYMLSVNSCRNETAFTELYHIPIRLLGYNKRSFNFYRFEGICVHTCSSAYFTHKLPFINKLNQYLSPSPQLKIPGYVTESAAQNFLRKYSFHFKTWRRMSVLQVVQCNIMVLTALCQAQNPSSTKFWILLVAVMSEIPLCNLVPS